MILFVFEGGKAEPAIFDSLKRLFLTQEEVVCVSCSFDLPNLYSHLKECGYDFQHNGGLSFVNDVLDEMLDYFCDETENGKLYVNYPMVESLKYTKQLPDADYCDYIVSRETCVNHHFKSDKETISQSRIFDGQKICRTA